jgi:hypothetical protein
LRYKNKKHKEEKAFQGKIAYLAKLHFCFKSEALPLKVGKFALCSQYLGL